MAVAHEPSRAKSLQIIAINYYSLMTPRGICLTRPQRTHLSKKSCPPNNGRLLKEEYLQLVLGCNQTTPPVT
jgi:hypothetical protein